MTERTLTTDERAYKNMVAVAKMLEAVSADGTRYEVEDCYLDFGQNWMWTTIIAHKDTGDRIFGGTYQAISPRQWKDICLATSIRELAQIAERI